MNTIIRTQDSVTIDELALMVKKGFDSVDKRFDAVDRRFENLEMKFDKRCDSLEEKFDKRCDILESKFDSIENVVFKDHAPRLRRIEKNLEIA